MRASVRMLLPVIVLCLATALPAFGADRVKTANGMVESTLPPRDGVRSFKGIPFAQPPVGDLRWREPQPVKNWPGVRNADTFGPTCMQRLSPNADYWFRGDGMSEDCLYLNVWTPAKSGREKLPVLVYIFGGGFQNGDGSEPRYDGESMARKGIVAVSLNYRTNIFGFFAHPELTKESPHHASGNYGLLDQVAALQWVQKNIAAFGGDPKRVTIAGESAGSISVSALMASPLSRNLMAGAICESGAAIASLPPRPLAESEQNGVKFAAAVGADSLAALRAMSAQQLQDAAAKAPGIRFSTAMDGYFLSKTLTEIALAGEQARSPAARGVEHRGAGRTRGAGGRRSDAGDAHGRDHEVLRRQGRARAEGICRHDDRRGVRSRHASGQRPLHFLRHVEMDRAAHADRRQAGVPLPVRQGASRVSRHAGPAAAGSARPITRRRAAAAGASRRGALRRDSYAMGNLDLDRRYAWEPADYDVSKTMQAYFVNFIKTGKPDGPGLPPWPAYTPETNYQRMRIDVTSQAGPEPHRDRYLALDAVIGR